MKDPYAEWMIGDFTHWAVYLHRNQYYLGRSYIWLKRDVIDLMDTSVTEYLELMIVANRLKQALNLLWAPDQYNWAALGNCTPHCHVHLIPRYREPREFNGVLFTDHRWGQNYVPYDKDFRVTETQLAQIRDSLSRQLRRVNQSDYMVSDFDRSCAAPNNMFGGFGNDGS